MKGLKRSRDVENTDAMEVDEEEEVIFDPSKRTKTAV